MYTVPTFRDIEQAHDRIRHVINKTPVLQNRKINEEFGAEIMFKCEN